MTSVGNEIDWLLEQFGGQSVSVAGALCDRWAADPSRIGLRYEDATGHRAQYTFAELRERSRGAAATFADLGIRPGDRVATLLPKRPDLPIGTLGLWRLGAVHVPLFTAFGPEAIRYRVEDSGARLILTDAANRPKIPELAGVTVLEVTEGWEAASQPVDGISVSADDPFILIYTSGTTGQPKGVEVPVKALAAFAAYMSFGLDVRPDDVHWNVADPGWAYGLYYGLTGTLLLGQAPLYYNAPFSPEAAYDVIRRYGVTNFAAAPTAYRALRASGLEPGALPLRALASAGEPLNPDVIAWAEATFGRPIHDQYGQTEHGMFVVNCQREDVREPLKPGSMGRSMPGFHAAVIDAEGRELSAGEQGEVAIDVEDSPLYWFRGYRGDSEGGRERLLQGRRYCLTGDSAEVDGDGYIFFSSRADDVISSAGYRIGPFEVESSLMGHPAVGEAAVIGVPDQLRGEVVKAFVVLRPDQVASDDLASELREFVRERLSKHAYPREIEFVAELPKTPSGKVQRYLLREAAPRVSV